MNFASSVRASLRAPAKLNLTLEVIERLPDGYHALRSAVIAVPGLDDHLQVDIEAAETPQIILSVDSSEVPGDERNICYRIAARYMERTNASLRVSIALRKVIPVAAGLGGGSSDAATVLLALNRYCNQRLSPSELVEIAAPVGRDIPFFLASTGAAVVAGTGEQVHPFESLIALRALIINPRISVATRSAYEALSRELWFMSRSERRDRTSAVVAALGAGDLDVACASLYNDFELVVEPLYPIVKVLKQALLAFGASGASLSGSGPSVFGLFASQADLRSAERALRAQYPDFIVATVSGQ